MRNVCLCHPARLSSPYLNAASLLIKVGRYFLPGGLQHAFDMVKVSLPVRRSTFLFLSIISIGTLCLLNYLSYRDYLANSFYRVRPLPLPYPPEKLRPQQPIKPNRVSCVGPRGRLLSDSQDDEIHAISLDLRM